MTVLPIEEDLPQDATQPQESQTDIESTSSVAIEEQPTKSESDLFIQSLPKKKSGELVH